LGGLRHAKKDSHNKGWRNLSFRGFADYMETNEFLAGLNQLDKYIKQKQVVIMCAEAVPWRCHRSLIADAEIVKGIRVKHIIKINSSSNHKLTSFAKVISKTPLKIKYTSSSR
jgi:uncharacterized protein (DUF488 family)